MLAIENDIQYRFQHQRLVSNRRFQKMHAKTFCFALGFVSLLALQGCGSNDNKSVVADNTEMSDMDAKQNALTYVPGGTVGPVEKIDTPDEHRWGVTVSTASGAEVVVEFERVGGHLAEINSDKGPFEYELPAAAPGYILYSKARSVALATKQGQLEAWEVKLAANIWEMYVRDTSNKLWEVKLNAETGAVISTIEKAMRD
jgi:uncharacterized membrane protein YkoI